jgi:pimeloyl-ACP methyl ester carboxylesterase
MDFQDDDLERFDNDGPPPLPVGEAGFVGHEGARIWYAVWGDGPAVILLHGGLGNSNNFAHQVPALIEAGYRTIVIDSRGHGRSSRDERPYSYELLGGDVLAVMDRLAVDRAAFIGWSDGACTALLLADSHPERVAGVFFFACNMDPSGTLPFEFTPTIGHCISRHRKDYAALSSTPADFDAFSEAVGLMQRTQPNYTADDLGRIAVPVLSVLGEHDEFIKREHAEYLARAIPGASFKLLPGVSHFAPLQRPAEFNRVMLEFVGKVWGPRPEKG